VRAGCKSVSAQVIFPITAMGLFSPFLRLRSNEKTFFRAGSQPHRSLFASRTSDQAAVAIPKCHCARTNPPLVQFVSILNGLTFS
jgi:hypothetical protein